MNEKKLYRCSHIPDEVMAKEFPKEGICYSCTEFTYLEGLGTCPRASDFIPKQGGVKH